MRATCSRSTLTSVWRTVTVSKSQLGRALYHGSSAVLVLAVTLAMARTMRAGWRPCSRLSVAMATTVAQILCSVAPHWWRKQCRVNRAAVLKGLLRTSGPPVVCFSRVVLPQGRDPSARAQRSRKRECGEADTSSHGHDALQDMVP